MISDSSYTQTDKQRREKKGRRTALEYEYEKANGINENDGKSGIHSSKSSICGANIGGALLPDDQNHLFGFISLFHLIAI